MNNLENQSIPMYEKKKILRIALFAGEILLKNGAEIYRVEDTIIRICQSKGLENINVNATPTFIIIGDDRYDGFTFVKNIRKRGINIEKICAINDFSRQFVQSDTKNYDSSVEQLLQIDKNNGHSPILKVLFAAVSSGMFTAIFGGNFLDFISAVIVSATALLISEKIERLSSVSFLGNGFASFIITVITILFIKINLAAHLDLVIVGAIYPLLPGVAFTNGIRDFISGDLISGVAKIFEALMIAVAISTGVGSALVIWLKIGGVL